MNHVKKLLVACALVFGAMIATPSAASAECNSEDFYVILNILNQGPTYSNEAYDAMVDEFETRCSVSQKQEMDMYISANLCWFCGENLLTQRWNLAWEWLAMHS